MNLYQPTISGSLTVSGSVEIIGPFTMSGGSISGTASFAQNAGLLSSLDSSSFVGTGSYNTMSSSVSTRVTNIEGNYATTGSNIFLGAQTVCANITSTGTIIAQTLNVQQVTSSVVYSSGSNVFGCDLSNVQQFTGSVRITGSLNVVGNTCFNNNSVISTTGDACFDGIVCSRLLRLTYDSTGADALYFQDTRVGGSGTWRVGAGTGGTGFGIYNNDTANTAFYIYPSGVVQFSTCGAYTSGSLCSTNLYVGTACANTITSNGSINILSANSLNLTSCVSCVKGLFGQINAGYGSGGTQNAASIEFQRTALTWGDNGDIVFKTNPGGGTNTERLRINNNGVSCFAGQVCTPGMDIMPSGIGVSTLSGIMRVVTTGTSTGIAVGQSNTNRYTHFAANDIQVFNDDFFLSTRCAFPLSIGTCYTARLTFAATGEACFRCQVCLPTSNTSLVAGTYGTISNVGGIDINIGNNAYYDGTNWRRFAAQEAARIYINRDSFTFLRKASDGAGSCISWDNTLVLASSGIACFTCQVCAPSFIASSGVCITSNTFTKAGPNSSIVTLTTTTTSGCTCAFTYGSNGYAPGMTDNISGLIIVNVNESNSNIQLNSGLYVGMVNNPRGANACVIEISRNVSSTLSLKVTGGSGNNNIEVCACSSSGINTPLRYTLTFIGGGGTS